MLEGVRYEAMQPAANLSGKSCVESESSPHRHTCSQCLKDSRGSSCERCIELGFNCRCSCRAQLSAAHRPGATAAALQQRGLLAHAPLAFATMPNTLKSAFAVLCGVLPEPRHWSDTVREYSKQNALLAGCLPNELRRLHSNNGGSYRSSWLTSSVAAESIHRRLGFDEVEGFAGGDVGARTRDLRPRPPLVALANALTVGFEPHRRMPSPLRSLLASSPTVHRRRGGPAQALPEALANWDAFDWRLRAVCARRV